MGKRHRPRKQVEVSVRIFGTDARGQIFSEKGESRGNPVHRDIRGSWKQVYAVRAERAAK